MLIRNVGRWFLGGAAVVSIAACGVSVADFTASVDRARACHEGDTCVIEGYTPCTCGEAVLSTQAADIRAMAPHVACPAGPRDGGVLQCPAQLRPRCENQRCVADHL